MKYFKLKFLTFFLTALLAFGVGWAETATLPNTQALTTNFANVGNDTHIQIKTSSANSYTNPLRIYANTTVTIKAVEGYAIQSVTYEASSTGTYVTNAQNATVTPEVTPTVSGNNVTWTFGDNVTEFTFTPSAQTRANSITITYDAIGGSSLTPVTISFPEDSYTATLGETFTAPTLSVDPAGAASEVTYSSSNTDVATVDESTGAITLVAAGTTTITAEISGSDTYNNATASYTLTVEEAAQPGIITDFKETFTGCDGTGGNDNSWSGTIASNDFDDSNADHAGWELVSGNAANKCIKLGTGSKKGSATTPSILVTPGTTYTLKFKAAAWDGSKENKTLVLSATGGTISPSSVTLTKGAWTEYTITFVASENSATITFAGLETTNSRFFLDEVVLSHKENASATPYIIVNSESLTISDNGTDNFFTVQGGNLIDNIGVTPSEGFSTDVEYIENNNGSAEGTITVTYTGLDLYAQGTVEMGTDKDATGEDITKTVSITYQPDIYIVGDYGSGWNFADGNKQMSENGGVYTYELNVENTNTFIAFARKVGDGVGFNTRYVFTPTSNGDWEMDADEKGGTINVNGAQPIHFQYAGLYAIEINASGKTFTITRTLPQVEKPKITPNGGNFPASQTVTITTTTDGASIYYTTDESEPSAENGTLYEGELTLSANTTLKAIAVKDGMRPSEVATATFTKTGIDDLAGVIALGGGKNFTFVGNVVVTFKGTYGNHTLVGLRDVSQNNAEGKGGCVFYNPSTTSLEAGNTLAPEWTGRTYKYGNSWIEINNANNISVNGNAEVQPFDRTGESLTNDNQSEYIILRDVTIDAENKTATWTDGSRKTINYSLFNRFDDVTYVSGKYEYLIGLVSAYSENPQIYPIELKKAQQDLTLSFDPASVELYVGETFTAPELKVLPEGATIDVTYSSNNTDVAIVTDNVVSLVKGATGTATITATFAGNDEYNEASATYTITVEPKPSVMAKPTSLDFEAVIGQDPVTETFTVMAENLKGDITLTMSESDVFKITPASIAKADMTDDGVEVTVTYTPTQAGNDNATITIASEAAESATVTLAGTATVPEVVAMPTFSLVAGSYTGVQQLTISCATEGATISYSTDGGQTWTEGNTVNVDKDMTIMAKASKNGYTISETATAAYIIDIPEELPTITPFKGYYQIKNNGNGMYANIAGRKTLNFTDAPADKAGTVIWLETNDKGQVQSIRSQAADLQGYANRAMRYVPEIVELVADKLNADGEGNLLGETGLKKIMEKFNESFDHHLYVEQAGEGWRLYGKTPSMQPVVDFYRENTAQVEAKLPMLESFINSALNKLKEKIGGQSVFTDFSLLDIWEKMGGTLTKPVDEASIMAFYREVLNNKNYVWDFAYQTAMIYVNNLTSHDRWSEVEEYLGEYAQYIDKIDQIRPDFKYYVVADGNKPDFISEGNKDIINDAARTIWTLEDRSTFTVNIPANAETTCDKFQKATTLYTDFAYELPEGVTAYKVTDVVEGTAITEALSGVIPAQTPVLLMAAEAGDKVLTLSTEAGTAVTDNLLVGPDYLINTYKLTTPQVEGIFNMIKEKLGEDFYNTYVKEYEHLMYLNSGTVNNKYFWGLKEEDVKKCTYLDEEGVKDYVVRGLEGNAFVNNKQVKTNKAFLVSEDAQIISLNKRGDVNHDGKVNIKDVTDLIDRLLDPENTAACPICSDFNLSGKVDIKDVTDLIDVLLTAPYAEQEQPSTGSQD